MRLIFDECIPRPLRKHLPGHTISTVQQQGWSGVINGALLQRVAAAGFDAFITMDKNLPNQQELTRLPFAIIVLKAKSNRLDVLTPLAPRILQALGEAAAGKVLTVSVP